MSPPYLDPGPSLSARLRAALDPLGAPWRLWLPQPDGTRQLEGGRGPGDAPSEAPGPGLQLWLAGDTLARSCALRLAETVHAAWVGDLRTQALRLIQGRAVHGLSNSLTPLLCADTAQSLTDEERARIGWRVEVLRNLARGRQGYSLVSAVTFLREVRRALEDAGIELQTSPDEVLGEASLSPDAELLRRGLVELVLAGAQTGGQPLRLEAAQTEVGIRFELLLPAETLLPDWVCGAVSVEHLSGMIRLGLDHHRPWLAWLGSAPAHVEELTALGFDLVVFSDLASLQDRLVEAEPFQRPKPCGVALAGDPAEHRQLRRQVMAFDLDLARVTHSAANWPACPVREQVDLSPWVRRAAGQPR